MNNTTKKCAKICLGLGDSFGIPIVEQIELLGEIGYDGFFTSYESRLDIAEYSKAANRLGMLYQSLHAPFYTIDTLWDGEQSAANQTVQTLIDCINACAVCGIPIMVSHAFIGFQKHSPTTQGIKNFEKIVLEGEKRGVKIAFENTEGEEYLSALMQHFEGCGTVGFCWDTGHEMCYNDGKDMTALYGDRLLCTHLNDNLGTTDRSNITFLDDLHLLPYDGITDWDSIAQRLARCGFNAPLTFELNTASKPNRHENDAYGAMPINEYFKLAYERAKRFAVSFENIPH